MTSFIHTRRLADLLSMDAMGPAELKKTIEHKIPRELAYEIEGKIVNARELLQTEGLAASGLIPTEVLATVVEGSEPARCMRNVVPTYRMNNAVLKVPYGETGSYLDPVAEGAEVPIATETFSVTTFTAKKYAIRPMISREMVADATFDVIAQEIRKAGFKIENTLNRAVIDALLASSADAGTYETDCGGSGATPLVHMAEAMGTLLGRGFTPTDIVWCPAAYGATLAAFTAVFTNAGDRITSTGSFGQLFGCQNHVCGVASTSAVDHHTWAFAANGNKGAVVIDRNAAAAIGMREDIGVEQFSDPIRDLVGMKVSARFDSQQIIAGATQIVQY